MRHLPPDRQQFLVRQQREANRAASGSPAPLRHSKTGPAHDTGPGTGALAGLRRLSMVVGWSAGQEDFEAEPKLAVRAHSTYGALGSGSGPVQVAAVVANPTGDATSWASWWTGASNATGTAQAVGEQAKDTPAFYVVQIKST